MSCGCDWDKNNTSPTPDDGEYAEPQYEGIDTTQLAKHLGSDKNQTHTPEHLSFS